jgi:hypothetical protein
VKKTPKLGVFMLFACGRQFIIEKIQSAIDSAAGIDCNPVKERYLFGIKSERVRGGIRSLSN